MWSVYSFKIYDSYENSRNIWYNIKCTDLRFTEIIYRVSLHEVGKVQLGKICDFDISQKAKLG